MSDDLNEVFDDNLIEDGGDPSEAKPEETNVEDTEAERVRRENRQAERSVGQKLLDGINTVSDRVTNAAETDRNEDANTAERLANAEQAKHDAQRSLIDASQELAADAGRHKANLEQNVSETDDNLHNPEPREAAIDNFEANVEGGEVNGDFTFGLYESVVNTEFLADDVVKMRNVEDNAYTHGEREGRSLPFIEEADIADQDARQWAQRFNSNFSDAASRLDSFVDLFNLDDRLGAYEESVNAYEETQDFEDRLDEIDENAETGLDAVNNLIGDEFEDLEDDHLEIVREAQEVVGGHMNGREEGVGQVDLNHPERQNAEELVNQYRARTLDAAALHKNRLDNAREEIADVRDDIRETRNQLETYIEKVEDVTAVEGLGDQFADLLGDMGVETVMDVAKRNDYDSNPEFQKQKRTSNGGAVPDADELRENAFEYFNEIVGEVDAIDLQPTDTIRDVGDDYSDEDQRRRHFEAVYDASNALVNVMTEFESRLPSEEELEQYDPEWDGEYDSLEEERQAAYDNLDVDFPANPSNIFDEAVEYNEE